ncbi:DUF1254 domain-containing protein [Brucella endophytica]|uniref:DUF1254 domain-containing protein n=1 Tax=Brucella endophytica TaxID=1963359 RepID=A0A916SQP3_9HYPH|nr:DUF1254 domain-containing protein [Brucella endophytica]GGB08891.1 DUF1254 domain-containing protein [Brucella endophytica]
MGRLVYALGLGLIGAGIVHIAVLLLVPVYSDRNAWSRITAQGEAYRFHVLDAGKDGGFHDPLFQLAACRFDLADGPVQVTATGNVPFWSVSVHGRNGETLYSVNDRASTDGKLDLVVANRLQMVNLKKDLPEEAAASILAEEEMSEGFVLIRAYTPDPTWVPSVRRFLSEAGCETLPV